MGLKGKIARVLSFTRILSNHSGKPQSDVKVDPGGGENVTAEHFADAGDDSYPLDLDYSFITPQCRSGRYANVGYADVVNMPRAGKGEKRIYARDPETGEWVAEIWLKSDGTISLNNKVASVSMLPSSEINCQNSNGYHKLRPDGEIEANGARITKDGDFVTASGVSLDNHPHNQGNDGDGDSEVPTDPPTPTE